MGRFKTPLARGLQRALAMSGLPTMADLCSVAGVNAEAVRAWQRGETEPMWLRTLRAIKRSSGLTWDELLDGRRRQ